MPYGYEHDTATLKTEHYAYDGHGALIGARNSETNLQWFYDAAGNLTREHQHMEPLGKSAVWRHTYNELNIRVSTIRPDGHRVDWLTYGSGHVHGLMLDGQEMLAFGRDDLHREVERIQGNLLAQTKAYDPVGRLTQQVLKAVQGVQGDAAQGGAQNTQNTQNTQSTHSPHAAHGRTNIERRYQYDVAGQLTRIDDSRRGQLAYQYDPVGRLQSAHSALGKEVFAFDPAGNLLDGLSSGQGGSAQDASSLPYPSTSPQTGNRLLDNLLRDYVGTHYEWDAHGNLITRTHNGEKTTFQWDALGRLTQASTHKMNATFVYDALGRRVLKNSEPIVRATMMDGKYYKDAQRVKLKAEHGYGYTAYGWDGDLLAWESRWDDENHSAWTRLTQPEHTTHYIYEPGSFVPLMQATEAQRIDLMAMPGYMRAAMHRWNHPEAVGAEAAAQAASTGAQTEGATHTASTGMPNVGTQTEEDEGDVATLVGEPENPDPDAYDFDTDPMWQDFTPQRTPGKVAYYNCDHLGTPQEMTDEAGEIIWSAHYKAWGAARTIINNAAKAAGIDNHLRFQGQYFDVETGLHYNRYRYYDPQVGRFISRDPIGLAGGINVHQYAPNPVAWIDPLGLEGEINPVTGQPKGTLQKMANAIRKAGKYKPAVNQRTIAVGQDDTGGLFAGSSNGFDAGQREMADKLGVKRVPSSKGNHAEENLMKCVLRLKSVGTSKRFPCGHTEHNCEGQLKDHGIDVDNI